MAVEIFTMLALKFDFNCFVCLNSATINVSGKMVPFAASIFAGLWMQLPVKAKVRPARHII